MKQRGVRKQKLQEQGFKATTQRLIIAEVVQNSMEHLSSDEIFERVKEKLPGISRATVYNTLHTLAKCGMICELDVKGGKVIYDGNPAPHHHLVCEKTGEIYDIPQNWVKDVDFPCVKRSFDVTSYTIIFRGRAKSSARKKGVRT